MNDLDLLDRFGPKPTDLSAAALGAARARLETAMTRSTRVEPRSRHRLPLLAATAAAVVGLAITPSLVGSDQSVALAGVDPLVFPLTPTALPAGLGDAVFERDSGVMAARYGSVLDGVSVVTDVEGEDFWSVPDDAPKVQVHGHPAAVISRIVHDGTPASAPAVTLVWQGDDHEWTGVTGSGRYADAGRVAAIAESLREEPQPVDLAVSVAPRGWSVTAYKEDRILTLAAPGGAGPNELTVALVDRPSANLSGYGAQDVETLTINGAAARLGRQAAEAGAPAWILEAQTSSGQAFSLQAPAALTRDQVIQVAEGVTYQP